MCVPELMANKANELAARHAYPFPYYTVPLAPCAHEPSCLSSPLNPETTVVPPGCQQDESVLRREHRLTPGSNLRCNTFFFFLPNATSCCIELHQTNCSASSRLSLRCLVFAVRTALRSGERDLFSKGEEGERGTAFRICYFKSSLCIFFHHVTSMFYC